MVWQAPTQGPTTAPSLYPTQGPTLVPTQNPSTTPTTVSDSFSPYDQHYTIIIIIISSSSPSSPPPPPPRTGIGGVALPEHHGAPESRERSSLAAIPSSPDEGLNIPMFHGLWNKW
jgi:hypothetical protein